MFGAYTHNPQIEETWLNYPQYADNTLEFRLRALPTVNKNDIIYVKIIKEIFRVKPLSISARYIYLASSMEIDGFGEGETDLILKIRDLIGNENLAIKKHPRDTRSVYEDAGLNVIHENGLPWELMMLCNDYTDKIFLTASSTAVISGQMMTEEDITSYYLFPLISWKSDWFCGFCTNSVSRVLDLIHKDGKLLNTKVISSLSLLTN
jgi:hypothetical protein